MPFVKKPVEDFIGYGLAFPIPVVNGKVVPSTGFDLIRSSIKNILCWPYGSRFYLSEFGSRLEQIIEEPNDDILKQLIYTFVVDPVNRWERRIHLIEVRLNDVTEYSVSLFLKYQILNSKSEDSFVFPFYRKIIY